MCLRKGTKKVLKSKVNVIHRLWGAELFPINSCSYFLLSFKWLSMDFGTNVGEHWGDVINSENQTGEYSASHLEAGTAHYYMKMPTQKTYLVIPLIQLHYQQPHLIWTPN